MLLGGNVRLGGNVPLGGNLERGNVPLGVNPVVGGGFVVPGASIVNEASGLKADSPFPFCTAMLSSYLVPGWRPTIWADVCVPFTVMFTEC